MRNCRTSSRCLEGLATVVAAAAAHQLHKTGFCFSPGGLLLQGGEVQLLVVVAGVVGGEVAVVVDEGRRVLEADEAAVRIALVCSLVVLAGGGPAAVGRQSLHQVLRGGAGVVSEQGPMLVRHLDVTPCC